MHVSGTGRVQIDPRRALDPYKLPAWSYRSYYPTGPPLELFRFTVARLFHDPHFHQHNTHAIPISYLEFRTKRKESDQQTS